MVPPVLPVLSDPPGDGPASGDDGRSSAPLLTVAVSWCADAVRVALAGELDLATAAMVVAAAPVVSAAGGRSAPPVVIDLSALAFLDLAGLAGLAALEQALVEAGAPRGRVALHGVSPLARFLLRASGAEVRFAEVRAADVDDAAAAADDAAERVALVTASARTTTADARRLSAVHEAALLVGSVTAGGRVAAAVATLLGPRTAPVLGAGTSASAREGAGRAEAAADVVTVLVDLDWVPPVAVVEALSALDAVGPPPVAGVDATRVVDGTEGIAGAVSGGFPRSSARDLEEMAAVPVVRSLAEDLAVLKLAGRRQRERHAVLAARVLAAGQRTAQLVAARAALLAAVDAHAPRGGGRLP